LILLRYTMENKMLTIKNYLKSTSGKVMFLIIEVVSIIVVSTTLIEVLL